MFLCFVLPAPKVSIIKSVLWYGNDKLLSQTSNFYSCYVAVKMNTCHISRHYRYYWYIVKLIAKVNKQVISYYLSGRIWTIQVCMAMGRPRTATKQVIRILLDPQDQLLHLLQFPAHRHINCRICRLPTLPQQVVKVRVKVSIWSLYRLLQILVNTPWIRYSGEDLQSEIEHLVQYLCFI